MTSQQTVEFTKLKGQLAQEMESYLEEVGEGCGYSKTDIGICVAVVDSYLAAVSQVVNSDWIMAEVQKVAIRLNNLNDRCNGGLIETDQRELICEIVNKAAKYAGLDFGKNDPTEEWRES